MSAISRRAMLKGSALVSAAVAVPAGAAAIRGAGLLVFDSSVAVSRAFARQASAARRLDLADEHAAGFVRVRAGLPRGKTIEGLTRWSDWVGLRSELESQGWRTVRENPVTAHAALFRWTMRRA